MLEPQFDVLDGTAGLGGDDEVLPFEAGLKAAGRKSGPKEGLSSWPVVKRWRYSGVMRMMEAKWEDGVDGFLRLKTLSRING